MLQYSVLAVLLRAAPARPLGSRRGRLRRRGSFGTPAAAEVHSRPVAAREVEAWLLVVLGLEKRAGNDAEVEGAASLPREVSVSLMSALIAAEELCVGLVVVVDRRWWSVLLPLFVCGGDVAKRRGGETIEGLNHTECQHAKPNDVPRLFKRSIRENSAPLSAGKTKITQVCSGEGGMGEK